MFSNKNSIKIEFKSHTIEIIALHENKKTICLRLIE